MKNWNRRSIVLFVRDVLFISIGLMGTGLGTAITLRAGLGTNALGTISDGLSKLFGMSVGQANILINVIFILPTLFVARKNIGIGTLLCVFSIGLYIDMFNLLLPVVDESANMLIRLLISLSGAVVSASGLSFYVSMNKGIGPIDSITQIIQQATNKSYRLCKTSFDVALLLTGIAIGGVFGIGTIVNVLSVGIFMQVFFAWYKPFFNKLAQVS